MMKGMTHIKCAGYASAVSAIKCTYVGGRTGIPTNSITERFLKDGVIEKKELDERLDYYRKSYGK
jgi:sulfofructose kinase